MAENISISLLPVQGGDCIHIRFLDEPGKYRNILIDGGLNAGYRNALKKQLEQVKASNEEIDLLVVTHIDDDHIGGILAWFKDKKKVDIKTNMIWFNSGEMIAQQYSKLQGTNRAVQLVDEGAKYEAKEKIDAKADKVNQIRTFGSVRQGVSLESYIAAFLSTHQKTIEAPQVHNIGNCKITVLSPTSEQLERLDNLWEVEKSKIPVHVGALKAAKRLRQQKSIPDSLLSPYEPDDSRPNGSSIAFLLEIGSFKAIFSGDAPAESIL